MPEAWLTWSLQAFARSGAWKKVLNFIEITATLLFTVEYGLRYYTAPEAGKLESSLSWLILLCRGQGSLLGREGLRRDLKSATQRGILNSCGLQGK